MVVNRATEVYLCICLRFLVFVVLFLFLYNRDLLHRFPSPRFAASSRPPPPLLLCLAFCRLESCFTHPLALKEHVREQTAGEWPGLSAAELRIGKEDLGILKIPYEYCYRDEGL